MKVKITIGRKEAEKAREAILTDPCENFKCEGIDCNNCPLRDIANYLREAQEQFCDVLDAIPIEDAE